MHYIYAVLNCVDPTTIVKHGTLAHMTRWVHHRPGQCWQIVLWKVKP